MYTKKEITKLRVIKNKKTTDKHGEFVYVFEWMYNDTIEFQEIKKISSDIYNRPQEDYDIQEIIEHKKLCCCIINGDLIIEQIEI